MKCIHIICRKAQRVRAVAPGVYESGHWDLSMAEAQLLIGGRLYLHEAKSKPSYFGGTVERVAPVQVEEKAHESRVIFTVKSRLDCKGERWRGADHGMAWTGGIIDCEE